MRERKHKGCVVFYISKFIYNNENKRETNKYYIK